MSTSSIPSVIDFTTSPNLCNNTIRPISDLRTHLTDIEEEAKTGTVILNRNGMPALVVQSYDAVIRQNELEIDRQKIHDAELWDRACGGKTYTIEDVLQILESDRVALEEMGLLGAGISDTTLHGSMTLADSGCVHV